ncbi:MAG: alkaline phosphatase D family protein [Flavobacteriales bacterium]
MKAFVLFPLVAVPFFAMAQPRSAPDPLLAPFYHGVASGDPTSTSVLLWTRVTDSTLADIPVDWTMALDTSMLNIVSAGSTTAFATRDHTLKVNVTGLQPNTTYYYRFNALGIASCVGRTWTLPEGPTDSLRLAVVSCASYNAGYFNAYEVIARRNDVDLVVHLGDYIYEYASGGFGNDTLVNRPYDPPTEILALPEYRTRHSQYKLDAQLQLLHRNFPFVCVWDDHEFANDAWTGGAENHQAGEGLWEDRKAAAFRAYEEWMPISLPDTMTDTTRIYRSLQLGDLADLLMLDTRIEGRDEQLPIGDPSLGDTARTLLGAPQRQWLFDRLDSSTAQWHILGQQVMVAPLELFGAAVNTDQWDGYPAERDRLLDHVMNNNIGNVVVLTGDIHSAWGNDIPLDNYNPFTGDNSMGVEFVATSVTSPSLDIAGLELLAQILNPHIKHLNIPDRGFIIVDINTQRTQCDWYTLSSITSIDTTYAFDAGYYVNAGERHLQEANAATLRPDADKAPMAPACPPVEIITATGQGSGQLVVLGVYPNPMQDQAVVHYFSGGNGAVVFSVLDVSGKLLARVERVRVAAGLQLESLDVSALVAGTYVLALEAGRERVTWRLVKEK